jgi:hypothetical protein
MNKIILFTFGYYLWGNHTPHLVESVYELKVGGKKGVNYYLMSAITFPPSPFRLVATSRSPLRPLATQDVI